MENLKVMLSDRPDFKMEAIFSLYDRKWNQIRVVSEAVVKYGKSEEFLKKEFESLRTYRNNVMEEIQASGFNFSFFDRFIQTEIDKFPFLLRLYFYSMKRLDVEYTDQEIDELIGSFVIDWINQTVEEQPIKKVSNIGELYELLDNSFITTEERMLILDTYANRKKLLSGLKEYMDIAVPILEKHFPIIEEEFNRYYKEYSEITDWKKFYSYFSMEFEKGVGTLNISLSILLFNKIKSMTTVSRGDYSSIGMRYYELKEWERSALVSNGILLEYLKAISDGTRLKILNELKHKKMRVKDLAKALSLTAPTISHHVSILLRLGIVMASMSHSETGVCEYSVNASRIDDICDMLEKLK